MRRLAYWLPSDHELITWFNPLGKSMRLAAGIFTIDALRSANWREYRSSCAWMGAGSLPFVIVSSAFIAFALALQVISEMYKYRAEDLAGSIIAIGLLRELGPLTVSLAWSARTAARISQESLAWFGSKAGFAIDSGYARDFVMMRLLAAISMAIPLSIYGLIIGFSSAAIAAPLFGANCTGDFFEVARLHIKDKDLFVYFLKIALVNPVIAVLAGCWFGKLSSEKSVESAANAVTATFMCGYVVNFLITAIIYFRPT
jgi:phospholipid/cholesterol/gamma-HCH transport system permease protein